MCASPYAASGSTKAGVLSCDTASRYCPRSISTWISIHTIRQGTTRRTSVTSGDRIQRPGMNTDAAGIARNAAPNRTCSSRRRGDVTYQIAIPVNAIT